MNGIADVMGLPVNVITEREFVGLVNAYLRNDVMNVVYMISVDTLSYMSDMPEISETLKDSNLILPAEKLILSKSRVKKPRGGVMGYRAFLHLLKDRTLINTIYVIGSEQNYTEQLAEVLHDSNPKIDICGVQALDSGNNAEVVINDINSAVPDVIVLAMDSPVLVNWMKEHQSKLNAKLCVVFCDMLESIVKENVKPAQWITKMGLEKVYYKFVVKKYNKSSKKERIFNALLAEYNNKRE